MSLRENERANRVRHVLDEALARPDASLAVELARRRALALAQTRRTRAGLDSCVPGIALAAAAIAVVMIVGLPQSSPGVYDEDKLLLELARLGGDVELIEDLDFYHWLDANGYAG